MTQDDLLDLIWQVQREYANNCSVGIRYASRFNFQKNGFEIIIKYQYAGGTTNEYIEDIPNYLMEFIPASAINHIHTRFRYLITRSFKYEVNHLFGKDFNPL